MKLRRLFLLGLRIVLGLVAFRAEAIGHNPVRLLALRALADRVDPMIRI